jgi:phosphate-selective porin OprO/OprP
MGRGDDRPSVDDMFFEAKMDGGIEIAAGQFKPSFGLDNSNSGKSSWFNERSMAADVFAPDRGIGFAISETKGDLVGSVALSNAENDEEDGARNIRSLSGRVVQAFDLPGKKHYLHIGGSLAEQLYNGGEHRLRTDAELDISGSLIRSPNNIAAVDAITYGFEAAYVYQQWAAQAEYLAQSVNAHLEDDFTLDGYYIALSWFLTKDEHEFKDGGLEKLKPDGDYGALELVARHSCVDLRVGTRGDAGCVQTLGINYYFDKDLRVNLQRIDLKRDDGEPDGSAWTLRGQYRF